MDNCNIYLAGGMTGCSLDEQKDWRVNVESSIKYDYAYEYNFKPVFFNPVIRYNMVNPSHKTEREPFDYDLYNLRKSDLVIVNFNKPDSLGTAMELAIAHELRIPVVALNENGYELHPWLVECTTRICDTIDELIAHVKEFYLI